MSTSFKPAAPTLKDVKEQIQRAIKKHELAVKEKSNAVTTHEGERNKKLLALASEVEQNKKDDNKVRELIEQHNNYVAGSEPTLHRLQSELKDVEQQQKALAQQLKDMPDIAD